MSIFDSNGNMKPNASLVFGIFGGFVMLSGFYFSLNFYLIVVLYVVGVVMLLFALIATKSSALDLRAFTNDPHGWRKAKATYKKESMDEVEQQNDRNEIPDVTLEKGKN